MIVFFPFTAAGPTRILIAGLAMLACTAASVQAQLFSYGTDQPRATQALSFGYALVDFEHNGDSTLTPSFDFSHPAFGAVYTRPSFFLSVAFGAGDNATADDLQLVDVSLFTWGEFRLAGQGEQHRLFLPVALHTQHRRVSQGGSLFDAPASAFNVTTIGLGAGLGYGGALGKRVQLETRAMPVIGLATRSFGDATGHSRIFDADAQLHLGPFVDRFGLTLGYTFRVQVWNLDASNLLDPSREEASGLDDLFDYRGSQHVLRAGLNW